MVKEKILCVDDEQNVLAAIQRQLRTRFHIDTAIRGELGLQALASRGPYAVVVSDMRMPEMDGVQFLRLVKQRAPDSVRIMLTGNHELRTAMQAVNEGSIFRFLTKPCPPETFADALEAGVRQYRLITAERDLLEKTLSGAIRVLAEILAVIDPQVFVRAEKLRDHARSIGKALQADNIWELEVSALLSQLGLVTIPRAVVNKYRSCLALSSGEKEMLARVPEIGRSLLAHIPRLESVAEIVLYQSKHFDGSGIPQDAVSGERIPLGARVLKIAGDLIQLEAQNMTGMKALATNEAWPPGSPFSVATTGSPVLATRAAEGLSSARSIAEMRWRSETSCE